jgi:16S rRNA (uracil1498-N3)-methyltransferase
VVRRKDASEDRKRERRSRIAAEAAKQCGRAVIPTVEAPVGFSDLLREADRYDLVLFCYEGGGTAPLGTVLQRFFAKRESDSVPEIAIVVGSEGGFTPAEAAAAAERGFTMVGLGGRILRTESASGFVLSCLVCMTELSDPMCG